MAVRASGVSILLALVFFLLPVSANAAPEVDYNYGPERSATPAQPKMDGEQIRQCFYPNNRT
ncbi:MAG: hypothetical protein AAB421_04000 [Patescibacteria group bacterium]